MTDLFGGAPTPKPKDRAPKVSKPAAQIPDAPAIARKLPVMTPEEYELSWDGIREGIVDQKGIDFALAHWNTEVNLRAAIGVELRQARMMKAALDGRCNRIKAGIIPAGRD